ncbi:MAG: cardiolipin synthase [Lachnospiraceae bacterium]|jgi:cardiolipin synthase|nr:cardiolipin synthase [Lachnospiraceae bacterium]
MPQKSKNTQKSGLWRILFSRTGIIFVMIIIQLTILFFSTYYLERYMTYIYGAITILGIIVLVYIINSGGNPAFQMTWMLLVLAFPVIGTLFYLFVKTQPGFREMKRKLAEKKIETDIYMQQEDEVKEAIWASKSSNALLAHYLSNSLGFPTYRNTQLTYFPLGEDNWESMLEELSKAKRYIFMEYFIVKEGKMWGSILKILRKKVREGVEVRFMYDGMNSISSLPYSYYKVLKRYGIKCKVINKMRPFLTTTQNNRDHRKICVIDGKVGYTGGINLADEYVNLDRRFGHWKDTAIMLKGEAVQSLTMMFLQMWNVDEREDSEDYQNYLTPKIKHIYRQFGYVIPYADSPFDDENVGEEVYFHILNHAKKYVHIMTPYLILDNEMRTTLTRVAKSGIEVIIIMPHIPDKWYAFCVAKTYYAELISSGVQIYEYTPGFVHAKVFVSDDDTATVGTINLDYRSLYLHFENGVFIYGNSEVPKIEEDFQKTIKLSHKVTLSEIANRSLLTKIVGKVMRIIAPLM